MTTTLETTDRSGDGATLELIRAELLKARAKHRPIHSAHEGYAVILEELDEFKAEVWKSQHDRAAMLIELIQTAAMCVRCAVDIGLVSEAHDA